VEDGEYGVEKIGVLTSGGDAPGMNAAIRSIVRTAIYHNLQVNTVLDAISKIRDTSMSHEKVTIIEVMGRSCGDIALYAGLAGGAESILVPEEQYEAYKICEKLLQGKKRGKTHNIIMLAEGRESAIDLQKEILDHTGIESRITVLGYLQRGGNPTAIDRILASKMGAKAVALLIEEKSNCAIGIKDNHLIDIDILEALAKRKVFDHEMYNLAQTLSI
jgi:6-phosphofructokinase 1